MPAISNLFRRYLRNALKPRNRTIRRKYSPLSQLMEQFELEMRWVPATLFVDDDHVQNPSALYSTINSALADANPGDTISVSPGTYREWVIVDKAGINLIGPNAGIDGTGVRGSEARITAPYFDTFELGPGVNGNGTGNGTAVNGSGHLINVIADDVTIDGFLLDGAASAAEIKLNPALKPTASIKNACGTIEASKGIANYLDLGAGVAIGNLTIQNNIIKNLGGDAISLNNSVDGGSIAHNLISDYGLENGKAPKNNPNTSFWTPLPINATPADKKSGLYYPASFKRFSPWGGIFLGQDSIANITNNTVVVGTKNYGIWIDSVNSGADTLVANNTLSVGKSGIGVQINLYNSAGALAIQDNILNPALKVKADKSKELTRGFNINSVLAGPGITLSNNTLGNFGNGTFDRAINLWNVSNKVSIDGGTIAKSVVGVEVDGVDKTFGCSTGSNVTIGNLTVNATGVAVKVTNINQIKPPKNGSLTPDKLPAGNVTVTINSGSYNGPIGTKLGMGGTSIRGISLANGTYYTNIIINDPATTNATVIGYGDMTKVVATNRTVITDNRANHSFDFGILGKNTIVPGYTTITNTLSLTASPNFGWLSPVLGKAGAPVVTPNTAVVYDRNYSNVTSTFRLAAQPAGDYTITVVVGDATPKKLTYSNVTVLGVGNVDIGGGNQSFTGNGTVSTLTFNVTGFAGGQMDIRFNSFGASVKNLWAVDAMTVTKTA